MLQKNKIHFEISERKILLRLFDSVFIIIALYVYGQLFDYYYAYDNIRYYALILLIAYVNIFGASSKCIIYKQQAISFKFLEALFLRQPRLCWFICLHPFFHQSFLKTD